MFQEMDNVLTEILREEHNKKDSEPSKKINATIYRFKFTEDL